MKMKHYTSLGVYTHANGVTQNTCVIHSHDEDLSPTVPRTITSFEPNGQNTVRQATEGDGPGQFQISQFP